MLSKRANAIAGQMSPLVIAHFECARDPYDARDNPKGAVNLGTASNHLMDDESLRITNQPLVLERRHLHYLELHGFTSFRKAVCRFFEGACSLERMDPDNLVVGNGSSSLLESLAFILFDPGDALVIPAPYYTGFEYDFAARFGVKILPAPMRASEQFRLDADIVKRTCDEAARKGENVRAILLTNPGNPTGNIASERDLLAIMSYARERNLHLISDEIYMKSIYDDDGEPFRSVFQLAGENRRNIHLIYGVAKDFCLSGFKVGFYYSEEKMIVSAMQAAGYFNVVSSHTQALLERMLLDFDRCEQFFEENRKRLRATYSRLTSWLDSKKVPYVQARAGMFCFVDFSRLLSENTFEGELELHQKIWKTRRVNITPGKSMGCPVPGWFRICFAHDSELLEETFRRLDDIVR